jgi:hypothetical protein
MKLGGLPVYDAKEPISFTVTKRDVDRGGVQQPESCAMALACKREQHSKDVRIHLHYSYILEKDHWVRYRTPTSVSREIIAFDRGGTFEPGEYQLLVPYKSDLIGQLKKRKIPTGRRLTRNKRYVHITANVRTRPVFASRILD